jgi:23S rRNA (cytidine2498-2'-O)-methyltransferase
MYASIAPTPLRDPLSRASSNLQGHDVIDLLVSSSETYHAAATAELLASFPEARIQRIGSESSRMSLEDRSMAEVAAACSQQSIVFVRHLAREVDWIPLPGSITHLVDRVRSLAAHHLEETRDEDGLALQVWADGGEFDDLRTDVVWMRLAETLDRIGIRAARANREHVLSVCVTSSGAVIGLNRREVALVDWSGGRVSLARSPDQVSRAEFKLEELFKVFDVPLPAGGVALDLGASPGGWTRILRRRGLTVIAVDPAGLDPRVARDPGVCHARTTAGRFFEESDQPVDLVVNDMRMTPDLSCDMMVRAAQHLNPGGIGVMSLKLSGRSPLPIVRQSLARLERAYDVLFARQLYHNRHEITIVVRRAERPLRPR